MDKLRSVIPPTLKQRISDSTTDDLHSTCSSLLSFFESLPLFDVMVQDLTSSEMGLCGKNKEAAFEAKARGNECFSKRDFENALHFYSQALRVAPADVEDKEKNLVATLYLNRASSLHKLGLFPESLRDCSRALMISPAYAKAWFKRAKVNSSLGNHEDAIKDLKVTLKIETSLAGKRQIESELSMLLDKGQRSSAVEKLNGDSSSDERLQIELQCVSTTSKGRGMTSFTDIPVASLIHKEEPYAAIILKHCRDTHCAFCFKELPEDTVPCRSCSIPLYCSVKCQVQAGGSDFSEHKHMYGFLEDLSDDIEQHIRNVTSPSISSSNIEHAIEHRHECQGMPWPAVLPSDVVLAGRILVKHIEQQSCGGVDPKTNGVLDLCENYGQLSSDTKLEFHVYSIILIFCLRQYYASNLPSNSSIIPEIIVLLSKIRINSMAIVQMKCSDGEASLDYDVTSRMEQVQVARAVYSAGSFFNHSCQPNVHAYFLSRTLFIRATENILAGSELELSYGPQIGQWDCSVRREFLEDRYSFICQCSGCRLVHLSDLVSSGYRCIKPNCFGVVLDSRVSKCEKEKIKAFTGAFTGPKYLQECILADDNIGRVARRVFEQSDYISFFEEGHCLSCNSFCDLPSSEKTLGRAEIYVQRLQDALASVEIETNLITDVLKAMDFFRTVLHPFNKRIAEVEDNIAQAFCLIGKLQDALDHCQASIEILEKLYGENHIVIGNELIKLASIMLSMGGHESSADNTSRILAIFSRHYGSHADIIFPHLQFLKKEACKLV